MMKKVTIKIVTISAAFFLFSGIVGCAVDTEKKNQSQGQESPIAEKIPVSFVLRDPINEKPLPHTRYRLSLSREIVGISNGMELISKNTVHGITDNAGNTGAVYVTGVGGGNFDLLIRHGDGKYGTAFKLGSRSANPNARLRAKYELRGCVPGDTYRGYTDRNDRTVYFATAEPCQVKMSVLPLQEEDLLRLK